MVSKGKKSGHFVLTEIGVIQDMSEKVEKSRGRTKIDPEELTDTVSKVIGKLLKLNPERFPETMRFVDNLLYHLDRKDIEGIVKTASWYVDELGIYQDPEILEDSGLDEGLPEHVSVPFNSTMLYLDMIGRYPQAYQE